MSIRAFGGMILVASLACAGGASGPTDASMPADRAELARELVEEGLVRAAMERIVEGFRRVAIERIEANVAALEAQLESNAPERRELARQSLDEMPIRFAAEVDAFLGSIDFEDLALDLYAPLYAERFEVEELQAILRFYRSPAGRAFARERPAIDSAGTAELAARLEATLEGFMREWFAEEMRALQSELGLIEAP